MTKTPAIVTVFGPRPEPGECYVCEIALLAHDEPRFTARDDTGELCADCLAEIDPPRAAALRVLDRANLGRANMRPGTPALDAYFATLAAGLRALVHHMPDRTR